MTFSVALRATFVAQGDRRWRRSLREDSPIRRTRSAWGELPIPGGASQTSRSRATRSNQLVPECERGRGGPRRYVEFGEYVADVPIHGLLTQKQLLGYRAV